MLPFALPSEGSLKDSCSYGLSRNPQQRISLTPLTGSALLSTCQSINFRSNKPYSAASRLRFSILSSPQLHAKNAFRCE